MQLAVSAPPVRGLLAHSQLAVAIEKGQSGGQQRDRGQGGSPRTEPRLPLVVEKKLLLRRSGPPANRSVAGSLVGVGLRSAARDHYARPVEPENRSLSGSR
jgi:hypothetical protein